jgi:hypothetical protein
VSEQKEGESSAIRTKLAVHQMDPHSAPVCTARRRNMIQAKSTVPKTLAAESEQAINFLTSISDLLKQQRRHFDDAVVTHCIRLISDYVEEKSQENSLENNPGTNSTGRRS